MNRFGFEPPLEELDVLLQRCGRDLVEVVVGTFGSDCVMRVLDNITAPQRVAAE